MAAGSWYWGLRWSFQPSRKMKLCRQPWHAGDAVSTAGRQHEAIKRLKEMYEAGDDDEAHARTWWQWAAGKHPKQSEARGDAGASSDEQQRVARDHLSHEVHQMRWSG